jgi:triphosphoribosyl-dephospho-CoA synthase
MPDSLVIRKQGLPCAESLVNKAKEILRKTNKNNKLSKLECDIILWDKELKQKAINPGTTADMTAATLLVYAFEQELS